MCPVCALPLRAAPDSGVPPLGIGIREGVPHRKRGGLACLAVQHPSPLSPVPLRESTSTSVPADQEFPTQPAGTTAAARAEIRLRGRLFTRCAPAEDDVTGFGKERYQETLTAFQRKPWNIRPSRRSGKTVDTHDCRPPVIRSATCVKVGNQRAAPDRQSSVTPLRTSQQSMSVWHSGSRDRPDVRA